MPDKEMNFLVCPPWPPPNPVRGVQKGNCSSCNGYVAVAPSSKGVLETGAPVICGPCMEAVLMEAGEPDELVVAPAWTHGTPLDPRNLLSRITCDYCGIVGGEHLSTCPMSVHAPRMN